MLNKKQSATHVPRLYMSMYLYLQLYLCRNLPTVSAAVSVSISTASICICICTPPIIICLPQFSHFSRPQTDTWHDRPTRARRKKYQQKVLKKKYHSKLKSIEQMAWLRQNCLWSVYECTHTRDLYIQLNLPPQQQQQVQQTEQTFFKNNYRRTYKIYTTHTKYVTLCSLTLR